MQIKQAASEFLACKRVAVTGVSRTAKDHGSNVVYKRLRDRGYDVFAVNPNAENVEGDRSYHDLRAIPGGVDAVVIAAKPDTAEETMPASAPSSASKMPSAGAVSGASGVRSSTRANGGGVVRVPRRQR